jgi:hypothetical protein
MKPSMPFKLAYNGVEIVVKNMVLYHPCPVRIENVQYDAVLQLNDPSMGSARRSENDTIILIPLAGSNRPDEAGQLISKIAPFITGLADTASGDVEETGGTTIAASNPVQQRRCDTVQKERDRRWAVTLNRSMDKAKRRMIEVAIAAQEDEGTFSNRGNGKIVGWAKRGFGSARTKAIVANEGAAAVWKDLAYVWDVYEDTPYRVGGSWSSRYSDEDWAGMGPLLEKIRAKTTEIAEQADASEARAEKKGEQEYLNMVETGIPDPNEPITPCEILNVGVGQDWSLSKFIPVGKNGTASVPYFTWTSSKVEYIDERADPIECTASVGVRPTRYYTRYIVMERPVRISSADLRSIRSLPPVNPTESGVRFIETRGILYRNAVPDNCKTCEGGGAAELSDQLKKGKVDKALLFNVVFSILGGMVLVMGVYFGLRWAMGTKGEVFKNLGVKVGSMIKGARESRTTSLPKGAQTPAAIYPSEKSKVSDIVPAAINAAPANLPAEVYRSPQATRMISGPRKRSLVARTIPQ